MDPGAGFVDEAVVRKEQERGEQQNAFAGLRGRQSASRRAPDTFQVLTDGQGGSNSPRYPGNVQGFADRDGETIDIRTSRRRRGVLEGRTDWSNSPTAGAALEGRRHGLPSGV